MFAVIKTGGKQYKVSQDDILKVERLEGEVGTTITLEEVLMIGDDKGVKVGTPFVSGQSVTLEILEHSRAAKIIVFKKKRRQNYRRTAGHRQHQTVLKVVSIGKAPAKKAAPKKAAAPKAEAAPKKAAPKKAAAKKS